MDDARAGLGRSRRCAPRGPCRCRATRAAAASAAPATGSGVLPTMSAPLRYARILKGFSPFSSSRSRDLAEHARDGEVIERRHRRADPRFRCEKSSSRAPPAARARAHGRQSCPAAPGRTGSRRRRRRTPWPPRRPAAIGARDEVVDVRRRDAGRQPLAVRPLLRQMPARCRPSRRVRAPRACAAAVSRMRSKQSKTCRSPSMWRFMMSQLLVPELRGAPV